MKATFGDGTNPSPLVAGREPPLVYKITPPSELLGVATYDVADCSQILSTHLYQENNKCVFWTMRYWSTLSASFSQLENSKHLEVEISAPILRCSNKHRLPESVC